MIKYVDLSCGFTHSINVASTIAKKYGFDRYSHQICPNEEFKQTVHLLYQLSNKIR